MRQRIDLARKKVAVLAASLGIYCMLLFIMPPIAVRHGIAAVWLVLPLWGIALTTMGFMLFALKDVLALRQAGAADGLQ